MIKQALRERIKENAEKSAKILADEWVKNKAVESPGIYLIISGKSLILTNQLIRYKKRLLSNSKTQPPAVKAPQRALQDAIELVEMEINTTGVEDT